MTTMLRLASRRTFCTTRSLPFSQAGDKYFAQAQMRVRATEADAGAKPTGRPPTEQPLLQVVLFEPQIPPNTGTIGRLCLATRCQLHLINQGFRVDDASIRRAGLDYWEHVDVHVHPTWKDYMDTFAPSRAFLFTSHGREAHWHATYRRGDALIFGNEHLGAPAWLHEWVRSTQGEEHRVRIPMSPEVAGRSINLASSATAAVYEALRQIDHVEALPF